VRTRFDKASGVYSVPQESGLLQSCCNAG
jgi:hypothetical protein